MRFGERAMQYSISQELGNDEILIGSAESCFRIPSKPYQIFSSKNLGNQFQIDEIKPIRQAAGCEFETNTVKSAVEITLTGDARGPVGYQPTKITLCQR